MQNTSFPDLTQLAVFRNNSASTDKWQIGVDEVGRGPLFGRVYAAAVIIPSHGFDTTKVKDSKKFHSEKKIKEAAAYIEANAVACAVAWRDENCVDKINVLQATQEAMHEAIEGCIAQLANLLQRDAPVKIMVDGSYFRPYPGVEHECFVQGDGRFPCIAAASIVAKVARDQYIRELCVQRPELIERYDLASNKGYGTLKHRQGIVKYGLTEGHRTSFVLRTSPV